MTRKGVYPYEYKDSFEWFQEPQLPPKDAFYSPLTKEDISETDYTPCLKGIQPLWHDRPRRLSQLLFVTNMLLLADEFKNFRGVCLQHYGLDPAHNYTSPSLSWQAALKMMDVELNLLTDIDQHLFIEEGIRWGIAMISHQYARVNASGMENYDASKHNGYIMYLDSNSLYGWAMSQPLPMSNFKRLRDKEMKDW